MDQHPIPRQITTFEFKLIGFLTIKQFIYLVVFFPIAYIVFVIFPIPLLNIILAALTAGIGLALAFLPINDRPLEVWIRNLIKRLNSPTQYLFHKNNPAIYFLSNFVFASDPHRVLTHIDSQEKLANYLGKTNPSPTNQQKQNIHNLLQNPLPAEVPLSGTKAGPQPPNPSPPQPSSPDQAKKPFFTGVVKNHKYIPLPGILIYVKNAAGTVLRLLKTNPHGIFATFNPIPSAEYDFEIKDPKQTYFFDTMKVIISDTNPKPLEFYSKEMI